MKRRVYKRAWMMGGTAILLSGLLAACAGPGTGRKGGAAAREASRELAAFDYRLAEKFWEQGQADLALRYLERAARKEPEATLPRLRILDVYLAEGNPEAALEFLRRLPPEMHDAPAFRAREALALDLCGRGEAAGRLLGQLASAPAGEEAFLAACAEHLVLHSREEEALALLRRGLSLFPRSPFLLRAAAELAEALGCPGEAGEYRFALVEGGWGGREDLEAASEDLFRARRGREGLARIVLAGEKGHLPSETCKAVQAGLCYRLGDLARARELLEGAFRNPAWKPAWKDRIRLAELRLRAGAYPEGAVLLEDALRVRPEDPVVRAALAWALLRAGRPAASRRILARAAGTGPETDLLRCLRTRLEEADHVPDSE